MALDNEFQIIFGADTAPLRSEVQKASDSVEKFGEDVKKAAGESSKGFDELRKGIKGIPEAFSKVANGSVVLNRIAGNLEGAGKAAIESTKAFKSLEGAPLQTMQKLDAAIRVVKTTLATGFKANLDTTGLSPQVFAKVAQEVEHAQTALSQLGLTATQSQAIVKGLIATFQGGFTGQIVAELQKAGVSVEQFQRALASLTGGTNLSPLVNILAKVQAESTRAASTLGVFGNALEQIGADGRAPLSSLDQLEKKIGHLKTVLSGNFDSPIEGIKVPAVDFTKLESEVRQGTAALLNFGNTAQNATTQAAQSFSELKGSTSGIAETFNKVAQSSVVLTKIDQSIDAASVSAEEAAKKFALLGNAPLNNLEQLDAELHRIKATLASGLKASVDTTAINPQVFDKAASEVELLIAALKGLASTSLATNAAAANLQQTFNQGFEEGITDELKRAGVSIDQFKAALSKLSVGGLNLTPLTQSLDQIEEEAGQTRKSLETLGQAPIDDLKALDSQLRIIRETLSSKLSANLDTSNISGATFAKAAEDVDKLRAAIAQLGLSSTNTTATAKNLSVAFSQGFTQGIIEELQKAGVSVDQFRDALSKLTGVGGANLAPLIQVLDSIQAESAGTTTAIKNIGGALQGVSVLAKAPINDLVKLDEELKVIKSTLASGFDPAIEQINLKPADFSGVQTAINQASESVESFGQTVQQTVSNSVQSIDGLKTAAAAIPAAFDKAEASATGLDKIGQTIERAGGAAQRGAKDFAKLGRVPLGDLKKLDAELRTIRNTLASGFKPAIDSIKLIPANFSKATQAANQFGAAAGKLKTNSNSAALALTDISRVAQDLPFGFIGIANNINPLVDSFARLKRETGSTGGALKALVGSLTGAGGLGLAIGVVTAAFTIYQNGILGFNRKTKEAKDSFEDFKASLRDSAAITDDAVGSVEGEIVRVRALASVVGDLNKSTAERKSALSELQSINKNYFGDLTLEAAALGRVTSATEEYTKALIQQAIVKGFSDEVTKLSTELRKQETVLQKVAKKYVTLNDEIEKVKTDKAIGAGGGNAAAALAGGVNDASEELNKQIGIVGDLRNQMNDLTGAMSKAVEQQLKFKSLDITGPKTDKQDAKLKVLKQELSDLQGQLEKINKLREAGVLPKFKEDDAENIAKKILDLLQKIDAREVEIKIKPKLEIDPELNELEIDKIEAEANRRLAFTKMQAPLSLVIDTKGPAISRLQDSSNEALRRAGLTEYKIPSVEIGKIQIPANGVEIAGGIAAIVKSAQDKLKENLEASKAKIKIQIAADNLGVSDQQFQGVIAQFQNMGFTAAEAFNLAIKQTLSSKLSGIIQQGVGNAFVAIGEGLSDVFNGGGLAKAAEGFLGVIGGVLQEVGKQMILASSLVIALQEALTQLFANPAAGLAIGIGLVALGGILKKIKLTKGPQKFAEGGLVMGPTVGMIGEAGPEMVIPLNRANQFLDNVGGVDVSGELRIRGNDLVMAIARNTGSISRKGGGF